MRIFFIILIITCYITTNAHGAAKNFAPVNTSSAYRGAGRPILLPILKAGSPYVKKVKMDDTHSSSSDDTKSYDLFASDDDDRDIIPPFSPSPAPSSVLCDDRCSVPPLSPSPGLGSPFLSRTPILPSSALPRRVMGATLPPSAIIASENGSTFSFSEPVTQVSFYEEEKTEIDMEMYNRLNDAALTPEGYHTAPAVVPDSPTTVNQQITDNYIDTNTGVIAASKMCYIPNLEIAHRLDSINTETVINTQVNQSGINSGDEGYYRLNSLWGTTVYNSSKQGNYKESASYVAKASGGIIGGDINITDDLLLGGAYSYITSGFRYEGKDKLDSIHNLISLYGQYHVSSNVFSQFIASFTQGEIKTFVTNINGRGSFKNQGYSFETSLFYRVNFSRLAIIPQIGLKYNGYRDAEYTIFNDIASIFVPAHKASMYGATAGVKFILAPLKATNNINIIPILSLGIERDIKNSSEPIRVLVVYKNNSFSNTTNNVKLPVMLYNVGLNFIIKYKNWELTPSYNYQAREKYQNQQIAIKLKLLF